MAAPGEHFQDYASEGPDIRTLTDFLAVRVPWGNVPTPAEGVTDFSMDRAPANRL
jgi:hypothetical protein